MPRRNEPPWLVSHSTSTRIPSAPVEASEDPELKDKAIIVGADPKGGKGRGNRLHFDMNASCWRKVPYRSVDGGSTRSRAPRPRGGIEVVRSDLDGDSYFATMFDPEGNEFRRP